MKKPTNFTNIIWKEGKYYVALCLNVDISSFGKTYEEALKNLNEALSLYLEDAKPNDVQTIEIPSIIMSPSTNYSYA